MDRNPSPPSSEAEEEEEGDAVGSTVYSKHWLFSILTRLIEVRRGAGGRLLAVGFPPPKRPGGWGGCAVAFPHLPSPLSRFLSGHQPREDRAQREPRGNPDGAGRRDGERHL